MEFIFDYLKIILFNNFFAIIRTLTPEVISNSHNKIFQTRIPK